MLERIQLGFVNTYLLRGDRHSVLVDAGTFAQRERLLQAVRDARVSLILLTHGHMDHAGGAAWLSRQLGCPIAMHPGDLPLIRGERFPMKARGVRGGLLWAVSRPRRIEPFEPAVLVEEGDSLEGWGFRGTIRALPGHTPGSIGVQLEQSILTGDAMFHMGTPSGPLIYTDRAAGEESLRRIYASGLRTAHPGHGAPIPLRAKTQ